MSVVYAGLACWVATLIVTSSFLFQDLRSWLATRQELGPVWFKLAYLFHCHLCFGVWVALAIALFIPPVVSSGVAGWLITALAIKGIGHLTYIVQKAGEKVAS